MSEGALQAKRIGQHFSLYILLKKVLNFGDMTKRMGKHQAFSVPIDGKR